MANSKILSRVLATLLNGKGGSSIVLTGEWSVGKTYFWNDFIKENKEELSIKKYAYISLFGIDFLDSLKYEI